MEDEEKEEKTLFEVIPSLQRVEKWNENGYRKVKSYVIRGQRLKNSQVNVLKEHFCDYAFEYEDRKLDYEKLFGNSNPVVIEIGFGLGDSTARIAASHPDINYIGIEVFLYGFSKLMLNAHNLGLKNLKMIRFDAVEVLEDMIEDSSVSGFHIFFPDPWPKKRHHKKRLIQTPFVELLAKKLKTGGYIYAVTDWEEYANQMLDVMSSCPKLRNPYNGFADPVSWRPETSFERKGLAKDYKISEVWFEKV